MRALGRRPDLAGARADVFVPRERREAPGGTPPVARAGRRPVPAAQEALMYPVDRSQLSDARARMMARRRRSLGTLGIGAVVFLALAVLVGGLLWLPGLAFGAGLVGYLSFLRSQARRDRERRQNRLDRASLRRDAGYDATADPERFERAPESVVRIDDDDIELQSMDTMDLTGLYVEDEAAPEAVTERRAS
jgi:hypothetical protein